MARPAGAPLSGAAGAAGSGAEVLLTPSAGESEPADAASMDVPRSRGPPSEVSSSEGTQPLSEGSWADRSNEDLLEVISSLIAEGVTEQDHSRLVMRAKGVLMLRHM